MILINCFPLQHRFSFEKFSARFNISSFIIYANIPRMTKPMEASLCTVGTLVGEPALTAEALDAATTLKVNWHENSTKEVSICMRMTSCYRNAPCGMWDLRTLLNSTPFIHGSSKARKHVSLHEGKATWKFPIRSRLRSGQYNKTFHSISSFAGIAITL